jgi:SAM-dependent methyltransferase
VTAEDDHVATNRRHWEGAAAEFVEPGRLAWESDEPHWGIWSVPESELHVLPDDLEGKDVVELGCGAGYVSSWLARRGARPVGLDVTSNQLATATRYQQEFGIRFPLVQADAERAPLRDATFDLAISEYGASIWCDPYRWVPEAARLLRPGGELVFLVNGMFLVLCAPDSEDEPVADVLIRDYFGMRSVEWSGETPSISFHLGYGDWIRLLRGNGFEVLDMVEVRPPKDAVTRYPWATIEWSRRWPCEEIWKARKVT